MTKKVQRRIAELALQAGFLDGSDLSRIMIEIGRRFASGDRVDIEIWIDNGWLQPAELNEVVDKLPNSLAPDNSVETLPADGGRADSYPESSGDLTQKTDNWTGEQPETGVGDRPDPEDLEKASKIRESATGNVTDESSARGTSEDYPDDAQLPGSTDTLTDLPVDYFERAPNSGDNREVNGSSDVKDDPHSTTDTSSRPDGASDDDLHPDRSLLSAVADEETLDAGDRFTPEEELGSGGSGRVVRAYDRLLDRQVAMKILRANPDQDPESLSRFVAEAQATGQLEHPNIVPIYDFGTLPNGNAFYTMREVEGHSLRQVLSRIKNGDPEYENEYTLVRLLNILRQVTQATRYAHVRSVIHRDLKPDNIMLGDFGEVLVMDWGLAQIMDAKPDLSGGSTSSNSGQTLGTPSYMPPEQAKGDLERVDETSDVYSLGAILYEILTLRPPFTGDAPLDVMWDVVDSNLEPPGERAPPTRQVPDELERICLKAMSKKQSNRYDTARAFHDDLETWLEGLQPREAKRLVDEGDTAAQRYRQLLKDIDDCNQTVRRLSSQIDDWKCPEAKQTLWEAEDERDASEAASARAFCEAVTKYTQALAYEPNNTAANQGLADLYWTRLRRAEMRRDVLNTIYFKTLVEQYDPGTYENLLEAHANLHVDTAPQGADIKLYDYEEIDRRLVPTGPRDLGESPTDVETLPLGSYLIKVDHEKCRKIQQPVFIERDRDATVDIQIPDRSDFEEGFRYIPGGEYIAGGDPDAFNPRPLERITVEPYFCKTVPVTFGEYLEWFNELYDTHGDEVLDRAPQIRQTDGLLIDYDEELGCWIPNDILLERSGRERYPADESHERRLPVVGIRVADAKAYADWLSEDSDRHYRLPTLHQFEKAGRGVDGRKFPWGNYFDATFCKMRFSRPEKPPHPEPVGTFEDDMSPYGVRDLAGGVQEWCCRTDQQTDYNPTKCGGWSQDQRLCHLASTVDMLAKTRSARVGFRLVYQPDR